MATDNQIIQGLWIGPELSAMEQLSIASFLKNGHEYHLYVYNEMKNLSPGCVLRDANEILPSGRVFQYQQYPSYAGFANFFRYKLLLERGGWWADTDVICLKPFDFSGAHVFASEIVNQAEVVASAILKAPVKSEAMAYAWAVCQSKQPENLVWGETGPRLVADGHQRAGKRARQRADPAVRTRRVLVAEEADPHGVGHAAISSRTSRTRPLESPGGTPISSSTRRRRASRSRAGSAR